MFGQIDRIKSRSHVYFLSGCEHCCCEYHFYDERQIYLRASALESFSFCVMNGKLLLKLLAHPYIFFVVFFFFLYYSIACTVPYWRLNRALQWIGQEQRTKNNAPIFANINFCAKCIIGFFSSRRCSYYFRLFLSQFAWYFENCTIIQNHFIFG